MTATLQDYHWLLSDAAAPWLCLDDGVENGSVTHVTRLRRELSPEQTHIIIEQIELRRRATDKFRHAGRMFFVRQALEEATDEVVAAYKAIRFPAGEAVVDFCSGVGGDLIGLAGRGPVIGVDRNPVMALLAAANLAAELEARRANDETSTNAAAQTIAADAAADWSAASADVRHVVTAGPLPGRLADAGAWHIDPDRRPHGGRTTLVDLYEPGPEVIDVLLRQQLNAAIKLAPGATLPSSWCEGDAAAAIELEWISRRGECKQLVAWFGGLAKTPGLRRATCLGNTGWAGGANAWTEVRSVLGRPDRMVPEAPTIGRCLYEPDAAVLAAHLQGALAAEHGLLAITPGVAYWTGDREIADAALSAFAVQEVLPYDARRVKTLLRARPIGRLDVKQRGTELDPAVVQRQLLHDVPRERGAPTRTLLLTRIAGQVTAILAERL